MHKWHFQAGELKKLDLIAHVDPLNPPLHPWKYTGLRVADVNAELRLPADVNERVIVIAAGESVTVSYSFADGSNGSVTLFGRISVFHGPSDVLYLPMQTEAKIQGRARIIVAEAPAKKAKALAIMRKADVPIFIRGAGRETRQIHNFCMPDTMNADRLICVEGIVPAGNWSGIPAHKHDQYLPGVESHLEEIYYFESAPTRGSTPTKGSEPFGYFRGYASDDRTFTVEASVHNGDVVLVPYGYHGPVAAAPGYDLYFFNVMAGPDEVREWRATDDPRHAWIRDTWQSQEADSRLPFGPE